MELYNNTEMCGNTLGSWAVFMAMENKFTTFLIAAAVLKVSTTALRCIFPSQETVEQTKARFTKEIKAMITELGSVPLDPTFYSTVNTLSKATSLWERYQLSGISIEEGDAFREIILNRLESTLEEYASFAQERVKKLNGKKSFDFKKDQKVMRSFKVCIESTKKLERLHATKDLSIDGSIGKQNTLTYISRVNAAAKRFIDGPNKRAQFAYNSL